MIIYSVYDKHNEKIFDTLDKTKADQFVERYNSYNINQVFVNTTNTDKIDSEADNVINSYSIKKIITISINDYNCSIENVKLQYINNDETSYAEIFDYCCDFGIEWLRAKVVLIVDKNYDINTLIVSKDNPIIKKLLDKEEQRLEQIYMEEV